MVRSLRTAPPPIPPAVAEACRFAREHDEATLRDQVELTEIPAPPFAEGRRADAFAERLARAGAGQVELDDVGNVLGRLGPAAGAPPLVISAHLDTVFPPGTDVTVARSRGRLCAPGIADDGRGLAVVLAAVRALATCGVPLARPLLVAATVGEEGPGDLRGVKHLFRPGGPCEAAHGFVSVDGAGLRRIVTRAVGSRRYRVCVRGRGGHSWADFGTPNPIHALGRALAELAVAPLPSAPRATLTVARIGGGTAVNAIPMEAWAEVDTRSEDPAHLDALEALVRGACARGVAAERAAAQGARGELALEIEVMGDRPAGATDSDHPLVRAAERATRAVGVEPERVASSTDANVPMALGLPAVTVGGGGEAGGAHTTGEWYRNAGGPEGVVRLLLLVAAVAGRDPWPDANAEAAAPRVAAGEEERR